MKAVKNFLVLLSMVLILPAGLLAQEQGWPAAANLPPEAQALITEAREIASRLQPIQQQALQDPQVRQAQQAVGAQIQVAMKEADPSAPERIARLEALMADARAAQTAGDEAKMGEIVAEARQIEQRLQATQAEAVRNPAIARQIRGFQAQLQEKMIEVDPEAERLLQRLEELSSRLQSVLGPAR